MPHTIDGNKFASQHSTANEKNKVEIYIIDSLLITRLFSLQSREANVFSSLVVAHNQKLAIDATIEYEKFTEW